MNWLSPEWLWLLLPLAVVLLARYRDGERPFGIKEGWLTLSALLVIVALCRPAIPLEPEEVELTGGDVIVAVDLSYSMQATDLSPSRLGAAQKLLETLVRARPKDRFGVIGFTTNAIVLSPLTNDGALLLHLFESLDTSMIMTRGTDFGGVMELARKMSSSPRPVVLLMTDGGDGTDVSKVARAAESGGLLVHTVMLATHSGTTLRERDGALLKDDAGQIVVTSRNDAVTAISRATGGSVVEGADADRVLALLDAADDADYVTTTRILQYRELFYWAALAAALAFLLGVTTLGRRVAAPAAALLLLVGTGAQAGMLDTLTLHRAQEAYGAGHYREAAEAFAALPGSEAHYNAATSYYKAGDYDRALEYYRGVRSADARFKAAVFFNIGVCLIRLQEFDRAKEALRKSLALYDDPEARENLYALGFAEAQDHMLSGRQKGKERGARSQSENQAPKKAAKEGGGSNLQVAADASASDGSGGRKQSGDPRLEFSQSKGALSSRQYELINKRSVHETKPW
jgi:Ca-activated chloride channel homolog